VSERDIIVIGGSAAGPQALKELLAAPPDRQLIVRSERVKLSAGPPGEFPAALRDCTTAAPQRPRACGPAGL
jgi:hypothetical protein